MAFAADYDESGRLYTYSTDAGGDIRIDLWHRSSDPDARLPGCGSGPDSHGEGAGHDHPRPGLPAPRPLSSIRCERFVMRCRR